MSSSLEGYAYSLVAISCFGSFAAPIKLQRVLKSGIHPVVFQCYKTLACFTTCWLALFFAPLKLSWWGAVGASIWVFNGTAAIVAVQSAGLGISQALWSGITVFTSFAWGTLVFHETVPRPWAAAAGLTGMALGMLGITLSMRPSAVPLQCVTSDELERLLQPMSDDGGQSKHQRHKWGSGVLAATLVGISNGSFMAPLKYAQGTVTGLEYVVSFGIGAAIATAGMLLAYIVAFRVTPSFHIRSAAPPAVLAGLLWSAGNFASIRATETLGMAVGIPLVQAQLIVSSLWGMCLFGEALSFRSACLFGASVVLLLCGTIALVQR